MKEDEQFLVKIKDAFNRIESIIDCDFSGDFVDPRDEEYNELEVPIDPLDGVYIDLPCNDEPQLELRYRDLPNFADELESMTLLENMECWTNRRYIIRLEHVGDYQSYLKLHEFIDKSDSTEVECCESNYSVCLTKGTTIFSFAVVKDSYYGDDLPPVLDEFYIEIKWKEFYDKQVVGNIVNALIFELASSHEIFLRKSARPDYFDGDLNEGANAFPKIFRPLLYHDNLSSVLNLYSTAVATVDYEFQIIGFVKVLEHISATVVKEDLSRAVRAKLLNKRALEPDSSYILELEAIIASHNKQHKTDSEALKLTVIKCCDAIELSRTSPPYLQISKLNSDSKEKERTTALGGLSASITATRNQIVHAKINYKHTGDECPGKHLSELAETCRLASEQAIRWYSIQHDSLRINE